MSLEHTNRRGDRYFIFQGKTKTGKPKYYASRKDHSEKGVPVDTLPDDFEIFEHPGNATVSVRRRKPSRVLPEERDLVHRLVDELSAHSAVQTIIDGDCIVIFTPDRNPQQVSSLLGGMFGGLPADRLGDWTARNVSRSADLRFTLIDSEKRKWTAERYCHRGFMEDWIKLGRAASLESLARKFVPHLGRESFYDLI